MRRLRPGLARLIALLLALQWASATEAHARALIALGGAVAVELCSAHGSRTVLLDGDGQPIGTGVPADCCDLCPAPTAAPPPAPAAVPRPVLHAVAAPAPARAGLPSLPPRAPPQQPRAPPAA